MAEVTMEKLISLAKRRGFIFQGSEIYDGLQNTWDFGPLGVALKRNIKDEWWKRFVERRSDIVGLDAAILMNSRVWEASGHTETFSDPLVEDKETHKRYRLDHLLEEAGVEDAASLSLSQMAEKVKELDLKSPDGNELADPAEFNLMLKTQLGATEGKGSEVYFRPETAQGIFVNFKSVLDSSRKRIPFGIGQIGKAFRNEITPGNFVFRTREFEQMEIEYFVREEEWERWFEHWSEEMREWNKDLGISEKVKEVEVTGADLAHYSKRTIDFEYEFPFGQKELYGLAYRTDHDLKAHGEASGKDLSYTNPEDKDDKFVPHVIEPSFGVERSVLAAMLSAYQEEEIEGEERVVMKFPYWLSPVKGGGAAADEKGWTC